MAHATARAATAHPKGETNHSAPRAPFSHAGTAILRVLLAQRAARGRAGRPRSRRAEPPRTRGDGCDDPGAAQRIQQHMAEERIHRPGLEARAVATTAFAGLTVPQYLTDMVAPKRKAGRPLANIANKHMLPAQGMTVEISRITPSPAVRTHGT